MLDNLITTVSEIHNALYGKTRVTRDIFSFDVLWVSNPYQNSLDDDYNLIPAQFAWVDSTLVFKTVYDRYEQRIPHVVDIEPALREVLEEIRQELKPLYDTMCATKKAIAEEREWAKRDTALRPYRDAVSKIKNWREQRENSA